MLNSKALPEVQRAGSETLNDRQQGDLSSYQLRGSFLII